VVEPKVAEITGVATAETSVVLTVAVALVCPAGIVMLLGTDAAEPLELKLTESPPLGAGPFSVTVAVEGAPPATVVGERLML